MSNGLDDLTNRRKRRQAPTPKHPRSDQPEKQVSEAPVEPTPQPPTPEPEPAPAESRSRESASKSPSVPTRSDAARSKRTPSVEAYLDQELMDWLWEIEAAAVARRERSVTSPTIRLALRELKARMTPEQVVEALLSRPAQKTGRPGRPKR